MKQAIQANRITFQYEPQEGKVAVPVLEDLSLSIEEGSFVAVLGHNGCGKSTLAKHFNAILLPQGGSICVYGMDTADEEKLIDIRRTVGMVFQNPDNQIVANVVEEDVAFAPENLGILPPEIRQRVDDALKQVGMYEFREHAPHLLSGGQKQRIAIAGVIAMRPKCIVLDEPTAMLDPQGRQEVLSTVKRLCRESGITVVLITHHMMEAAQADRILVMVKGTVIADGTPRQVFSQPELLQSVGLSVPQTTQLLYALNQAGCKLPLEALSVEECADALYHYFSNSSSGGSNLGTTT
ncbi:MAG: energy-coupling factor transporter ATPase [Ruminococcaceae bacterium]|nr:energy-coupling factor transporter ATPase [Oscillospiraceae bacterium]